MAEVELVRDGDEVFVITREGRRPCPLLRPSARVPLPGDPVPSLAPLLIQTEPDALVLGEYLWRALGIADPGDGDLPVLDIVTTDRELAALPWQWLAPGKLLLADRVHIRVHQRAPAPVPWSLSPSALVLEPDPGSSTASTAWSAALPRVAVRAESDAEAWMAGLAGQDLAHLVVEQARGRTLEIGAGRTLNLDRLCAVLHEHGPRLFVLEGPPLLANVAAELAAHCRALSHISSERPGEAGPTLGRAIWGSNLSLDDAHHALARSLPLTQAPRAFGEAPPPRMAADEDAPEGRWYLSDAWRVRLDRRTQTLVAIGEMKLQARQLPAVPEKHPGVVLVWHGPPERDLGRFRLRLEQELREERIPAESRAVSWPRFLTWREAAGVLAAAVGASSEAGLPAALAARVPVGEAPYGVLLLTFEIVGANVRDAARLQAPDLLGKVLKGWRDLVQRLPERVLPVLGIPIATSDATRPLIVELAAAAKKLPPELRPLRLLVLDELPNVVHDDIVTLIREEGLIDDADLWDDVADEILHRTGGVYDRVIRAVETLRWDWPNLYAAAKERKSRR